ncbi:T9SS type A sorting domain-containing protein [Hymenobacter sp. UV11]|uniref:M43 family zinc metalloprotease n=1 Tax=Hymenobacter sp. UV11 TaxID=1849735 RepID=UPI001061A903|nr:M43 family zinc metalloprotease [Hymenobacter sp. UV11]TFZ67520.1 T9SS type A sorting domain-containing protein [Hymenobacter sp. UV11]
MTKCAALLIWVGFWMRSFGAAGQALPPAGPRTCGTQQADAWQQAQLQQRLPGYRADKLAASAPRAALRTTAATTYTLPVVVHIVYDGEAVGTGLNISQAQVQSQLDVLNEDYRNRNANGAAVAAPFQPLRADAQFQFVLAQRDPAGRTLAEPGIDRIDRTAQGFTAPPYAQSYIDATIKPATDWNPDQYINIWVTNLSNSILGYAQFPDNTAGLAGLSPLGGGATTDGVVILYSAFGRVGTLTTPYDQGRTLTHELGHFLGLRHTWGDTNCGDDYCADTPTQQGPNYGCPTFPHVTCSNGPNGDLFQDFLDYSNDACMALFSQDQKGRMQDVMAAGTPRRAILLTSPALCSGSPLAASATNGGPVCAGSSTTLGATGPAGASYDWVGPNNFTSTLQNPVLPAITTDQAGIYTVRVSVTTGQCASAASTKLVVNPAPPTPVLAASSTTFCPSAGVGLTLRITNPPAGGLYTWTVVSGDGLPAVATTASIVVTPTQSSTYLLTLGLVGSACTSSATVSVQAVAPVWSGAAGTGSWFDAANWNGCVPSRYTDALIPAGLSTPYPLISSGTAEVRMLTQQGSLTLSGGELALYGDYAGAGPLTQTGGTVATRGPGAQSLRPGAYQTLLIAGAGTKAIGTATIGTALTMGGAILTTDIHVLTLAPTATLTETDASYVLGQVQTTRAVGTATETFGGLGVRLTAASALGITTVRRTTGQAVGIGTTGSISRYFDLTPALTSAAGTTLALAYLPHELNGLPEAQLTLFYSRDAGATWSNEGASRRDASAHLVSRDYVAGLAGRWTLASPNAALPPAAITYAINAFPVPFTADGLSIQVTTATAGPLDVKLYDVLGRIIYDQPVASVEVGTSVVALAGSGQLLAAKYILVVRQGTQEVRLNVVKQ